VGYWVNAAVVVLAVGVACPAWAQGLDVEPPRKSFRDGPGESGAPAPRPVLSPEQKAALDKAIDTLKAEAADLFELEKETATRPQFARPHPALKTFDAAASDEVLGRMNGRFTGKEVEDTYVRWHLMWVYEKKSLDDRYNDGKDLLQLIRRVVDPPGFAIAEKVEFIYEPVELWERYKALMSGPGAPQIVVGYPPFQKVISGQAALDQMSPEQRAAYERAVLQAEANRILAAEIFPKLTRIDYPANVEFNKRLRPTRDRNWRVQHIVRQYRGELIYALLKTGNPEMLDRIGEEIERSLKAKSRTAFDMMSFVYLAAFDGVLDRFDVKDRARFGMALERVARQHQDYTDYGPPYPRNFADYAFTAIMSMQLGDPMSRPETVSSKR
jgi:hypothetical protein